jgi:hypothetical protein
MLWKSYKLSLICKSIFIDGKIAAIFGISGILYGDTGEPWMVVTPEVQKYPHKVAFRYRKELEEMQKMFPILEDWVDENNTKAIRMLSLMNFRIDKNRIPIGDTMFRRAERRA